MDYSADFLCGGFRIHAARIGIEGQNVCGQFTGSFLERDDSAQASADACNSAVGGA